MTVWYFAPAQVAEGYCRSACRATCRLYRQQGFSRYRLNLKSPDGQILRAARMVLKFARHLGRIPALLLHLERLNRRRRHGRLRLCYWYRPLLGELFAMPARFSIQSWGRSSPELAPHSFLDQTYHLVSSILHAGVLTEYPAM